MSFYVYDANTGAFVAKMGVLELADSMAYAKLQAIPKDMAQTFVVQDAHNRLLSVFTNRRIEGCFVKQTWGGRKGNDAIWAGEECFDATHHVLHMDHDDLMELEDESESSDAVGKAHVNWDGPHEVRLVESVCAYFGVEQISSITPQALTHARNRFDQLNQTETSAAEETTVTLTIKVRASVQKNACINAFIENCDCTVKSNTAGVSVIDTEMVGAD